MRRAANSGEHRLPACSIRPAGRMPMFTPGQSGKTCFAASCRELQASGLCSPETVRHNDCYFVRHAKRNAIAPQKTIDPDIFFRCEHCNTSLVVNRAAAGMSLRCQDCGKLTAVPKPSEPGRGRSRAITGNPAAPDRKRIATNRSHQLYQSAQHSIASLAIASANAERA